MKENDQSRNMAKTREDLRIVSRTRDLLEDILHDLKDIDPEWGNASIDEDYKIARDHSFVIEDMIDLFNSAEICSKKSAAVISGLRRHPMSISKGDDSNHECRHERIENLPEDWYWSGNNIATGPRGQRVWIGPRADGKYHIEFDDHNDTAPLAVVEAVIKRWRSLNDASASSASSASSESHNVRTRARQISIHLAAIGDLIDTFDEIYPDSDGFENYGHIKIANRAREEYRRLIDELDSYHIHVQMLKIELEREFTERRRLESLIHNPHTDEFLESVRSESAHQRERWGTSSDEGKTAPDWYWLVGFLAGKALLSWKQDDNDKYMHHIITTAAACLNWHANVSGSNSSMRPGIDPPD